MIKKLLCVALVLGMSTSAMAQYYMIPGGQGNPGGLNQDIDEPLGATPGWAVLIGPSQSTPVWAGSQTIPFPFDFNGGPVTSFDVSSSGVVTFAANPGTPPAYASVALPSATIPDSSFAILGMKCTGTNDGVGTKVFGTAPNRQLYITFASMTEVASNGNFLYYSVVLEETSNSIYIVDQRAGTPLSGGMSLGMQLDGTTALSVNGSPNLGTLSGTAPSPSDNVYFEYVYGTQPALDLSLTSINNAPFAGLSAGNIDIVGTMTNLGTDTVVSYDVNYSINGGATVTSSVTGVSVATAGTDNFTSGTQWTPPAVGAYNLAVWTSNVNGSIDENTANDTAWSTIDIVSFLPKKRVVIEEGTGTWCGWCPRGSVAMEYMQINHEADFIGIAVHNGDPMTLAAYNSGAGITGFPGMNVDRDLLGEGVSTVSMETITLDRVANILPAADVSIVSSSIDSWTGAIEVNVEAHFAAGVSGDYRFAVVLVEDGVSGSGSSYAQANYYSGGGNGALTGAGHSWHTAANPVPASLMIYDHVGRQLIGGYNGAAGSLPATIAANDVVNYTFNATVANSVKDLSNVHFVVLLLDPSGKIVNANDGTPTTNVGIEELTFESDVYPNPTAGITNVNLTIATLSNVQVSVFNMIGEVVMNNTTRLAPGSHMLPVDFSNLPKGMYNAAVTVEGVTQNHKIVVQ